jgi:hypothetical protein
MAAMGTTGIAMTAEGVVFIRTLVGLHAYIGGFLKHFLKESSYPLVAPSPVLPVLLAVNWIQY